MIFLDAADIEALAPMPAVIGQLREAFARGVPAAERQIVPVPGGPPGRLCLLMPAFDAAGHGVVKLSTVFPGNRQHGLPTIQGVVVVFSDAGAPVAVLHGGAVTNRRTAAASALASSYLSRPASSRLLIVGTGELAPHMAAAHGAVRPLRHIDVWGRNPEAAADTAAKIRRLAGAEVEVRPVHSLADAVAQADIVSCATSTQEPLLQGRWLKPGTFVDLVGSFSPDSREADDDAILRARVFVDTHQGAMAEAGDLLHPLARGVVTPAHVLGELADLVNGRVPGRRGDDDITLFKSVGSALEDLALARLLVEAANARGRDGHHA